MAPVANILVSVVPRRLARIPPISGVQVLFKLYADNSNPNSVLEVPISLCSRLLRGPSIYEALTEPVNAAMICDRWITRTNGFLYSSSTHIAVL